jgi:hypothetical protein
MGPMEDPPDKLGNDVSSPFGGPRRDVAAFRSGRPRPNRVRRIATAIIEIARWAAAGALLGGVAGLVLFFVGSSRGLDLPVIQQVLIMVGGIAYLFAATILLLFAIIGRVRMGFMAAVAAAFLFWVGAATAFGDGIFVVPGTTTDGQVVVIGIDTRAAGYDRSRVSSLATCHWSERKVIRVTSRGTATWSPTAQAVIDLDAAHGTGTAAVEDRADGSSRTVAGTVDGNLGTTGIATFGTITITWTCPAMP